MQRKILIVEDDTDIARLVQLQLRDIDCDSVIINNGQQALQHLQQDHQYDMLILDIMLPDCDGLSICEQVRSVNYQIPILMLTARSSEYDRVLGLDTGADDYLSKPFSFIELSARVKALFRRSDRQVESTNSVPKIIDLGKLTIDPRSRQVSVDGSVVELTAREFDLLYHFASNPGQVFTRAQLLRDVWGYHHDGYEHTVNTHINRLRNKIEEQPQNPDFITTVWGVGYQLNRPDMSNSKDG
ncbi:MAG: response regulator transcription factor [Gammaproteobacteria bacterium]|nr:response regulator transcription factor [Gammaproteobacteria bacterium]